MPWLPNRTTGYYNTFYRKYDAQIGRFTGVDILSEGSAGLTPYQFGGNNPVMFNDPSGAKFVPDWIMRGSDWQFSQIDNALSASNTAWLDNFNHIGSSGGSSGGTTEAIEGGYRFTGTDAVAFLHGFLNAYQNPSADGSWSFTVGRNKNGDIGYWQKYSGIDDGPKNGNLNGVTIGATFVSTSGGGGDNFSLAAMYFHFQFGGGKPMTINASSLNFSGTSQSQLGLTGMQPGEERLVNLFLSGINANSLAFGKVYMTYQGNNEFIIGKDIFDFNIEWGNGFTARNAGTFVGGTINYNLMLSPASALIPLIFGGSYDVYFNGTVTIH